MSAATTQRTPESPRLAPDFEGILLAAAPRPRADSPLVIHGAFRIPWADADGIEAPRHRALVLVVTAGHGHAALTPFRERVLFEDDEEATRNGVLGYFNLDVFALLGRADRGSYCVHASLGRHVSGVLRVAVF